MQKKITTEDKRIQWKCRRGILEVDVILERFLQAHFFELSEHEKKIFDLLLDEPDVVLYDWFLGHSQPNNQDFLLMVNKIRKTQLEAAS